MAAPKSGQRPRLRDRRVDDGRRLPRRINAPWGHGALQPGQTKQRNRVIKIIAAFGAMANDEEKAMVKNRSVETMADRGKIFKNLNQLVAKYYAHQYFKAGRVAPAKMLARHESGRYRNEVLLGRVHPVPAQ